MKRNLQTIYENELFRILTASGKNLSQVADPPLDVLLFSTTSHIDLWVESCLVEVKSTDHPFFDGPRHMTLQQKDFILKRYGKNTIWIAVRFKGRGKGWRLFQFEGQITRLKFEEGISLEQFVKTFGSQLVDFGDRTSHNRGSGGN